MPTFHHLQKYVRTHTEHNPVLFGASLMVFFFVIFDGILTYLAPIIIVEKGISPSMMGIIIGSSSVSGMIFDLLICRILPDAHYRRMFFIMFAVALVYPFVLFHSSGVVMYLIAMAIWGFYYDLYNLGTLDLVSRTTEAHARAATFGVLRVFDGLGYLIAPVLASLILVATDPSEYMSTALWIFLAIAFAFYLGLISLHFKERHVQVEIPKRTAFGLLTELSLWRKIGHILFPVLMLTFVLNIIDAVFWTIGPLFSEAIGVGSGIEGGAFMVAFALPPLLVGWVVGVLSNRTGKKRLAHIGLFIGSFFLVAMGFIETTAPLLLIVICFVSSFFISLSWPSVSGAYADYIAETPGYEKEIATLQDAFTNLGNIIGPIIAGFSAQYLGYGVTFTSLGILGIVVAIILFRITPRSITVSIQSAT
ncbi:MAG: hypothetical protein A2494_03580 [Candidatus Lloydbacteria bacterium RIFOXYC12_FULL_46_25]|uniref:Major facilitator superfamily (MFS) profile domain-containing protein n=1 Tax=Candidatus Lloydbacteria bacterium RIFOXYC12_FULL_46_25 TaxID=1798670 RepID=A0A1G2DXK5_9BACT|nr:MAG: hypothetical protein A2494_03580 [Candidatus Lloydbacteria bacterium RIFOXYC12_FULL_46_25]